MRRLLLLLALLTGVLLTSACVRHRHHDRPAVVPRPDWTAAAKPADSVYLYRVGMATGADTAATAGEAAYEDALRQIAQLVCREAGVPFTPAARTRMALAAVEVMPGCTYVERTLTGFNGWIQVSCPITEKQKAVASLRKP